MKEPRLDSEFEVRNVVDDQFRDMAEAIVFLRSQLEDIALGKPRDPSIYARQAIDHMHEIFVPVRFTRLGGPS